MENGRTLTDCVYLNILITIIEEVIVKFYKTKVLKPSPNVQSYRKCN